MSKLKLSALGLIAAVGLTACENSGYPTTDADRAAIGAAAAGGAALLTGADNRDVAGAALVGGAAGALCDDAGVCRR
ncbi:hypothetical protein OG2516_00344 [Oceanicola granulosus HTCC2516]|uniref:Lipoprotein n=1 Tax=Oceanicola granulosus (strain ATCC BAA-861 / DSM 15982 / KCTC 12143 / HTCC2516) TaxID=314256 RepID=Q2CJH1_OCEGH|nr:hypothetical protein [Oceanicola granulosus]EAR52629.1 hypothetical protein OG2516_00344 [Oceanicola granulosus HTCC2516]